MVRRPSRRVSKLAGEIEPAKDVHYDPAFDDVAAGFGVDFIQQALGVSKAPEPAAGIGLEQPIFALGDI